MFFYYKISMTFKRHVCRYNFYNVDFVNLNFKNFYYFENKSRQNN